jgi:pyruvate/2-oxoglutarate dehydrogenase complex dihydrolipoamide acyltransferase (E2) component
MLIEIKVPQLSESVSEGTLGAWKKQVGEAVARDEIVVDIETDKVVLEVPASDAGVLLEVLKGEGETVVSDEVIARMIDTYSSHLPLPLPWAGCLPPCEIFLPQAFFRQTNLNRTMP